MVRPIDVKMVRDPDTAAVARWLLGRHLVRRMPDGRTEARMILETEAYHGEEDGACHARAGRTPRTAVMYAPGGCWYVYLCYGIHSLLNLVTGPVDLPAAVLIRGVAGAEGPGRLTRALQIDRTLNAAPALDPTGGLWLEDRGPPVPDRLVRATPRIGIDYAPARWRRIPWRFVVTDAGAPGRGPEVSWGTAAQSGSAGPRRRRGG